MFVDTIKSDGAYELFACTGAGLAEGPNVIRYDPGDITMINVTYAYRAKFRWLAVLYVFLMRHALKLLAILSKPEGFGVGCGRPTVLNRCAEVEWIDGSWVALVRGGYGRIPEGYRHQPRNMEDCT